MFYGPSRARSTLDLRRKSHRSRLHGVVRGSLCCERFVAHLACWLAPRRHELAALSAESEFRFALFQANQQIQDIAGRRGEEGEKQRLGLDLEKVLGMVREIVDATARLTWITGGYGWISIVAPIAIASPAYFTGKLSFGELMVVVGGFNQANQSLRWFVDNFALLAEWRAALSRVIKFREAL